MDQNYKAEMVDNRLILKHYFSESKINYYEGPLDHLARMISHLYNRYINPKELQDFLTSNLMLAHYLVTFSINGDGKMIVILQPSLPP